MCIEPRCFILRRSLTGLVLWLAGSGLAWSAWPAYRHDAQRSGVAAESLKLPLVEAWSHRPPHVPSPAWPELPAKQDVFRRVSSLAPTSTFDRAFHVAIAEDAVYYGSSADDTVYCLNAADGKMRWTYTTEGPVRLAPTVAEGRVYVGSDDGCVYCLQAADGRLLWKYRGGPADRRLPGNGRMISVWPVRCGIVVDGGTAYFCAGLFPEQGNYLCAVRATDGQEIWKQKIQVPSQGYLLASPSYLYVPTGRTAPQVFDRQTGKEIGPLPGGGANSVAGGCFTVLVDDMVLYSAGETSGIHFAAPPTKEKLVFADGLRVVADGRVSYILTKDRLYALDRAHWLELSRLQAKKSRTPDEESRIAALGGTRRNYIKWDIPCPGGYELILAGGTIFVGELDRVTAYDALNGRMIWRGTVHGKAYGLAVSDGRLYASTDQGLIHCFQTGAPLRSGPHRFDFIEDRLPSSPYPPDELSPLYAETAETAIRRAGVTRGYCLVLGARTGRLAFEIASRSQFHVVGLEPDAERVAEARRRLLQAGILGTRVTIHQGPLDQLPYQGLWANLIVSEEALLSGQLPPAPADVYRVLRPCGGCLMLMLQDKSRAAALDDWGRNVVKGWKTEPGRRGVVATAVRGPLAGSGEWSHFYGDSGNTACSGDALAAGPVDLQWFGLPGPRNMPDRHDKNVAPLYKNGRLFVSGDNLVVAVDAYNGTILWQRDVPRSVRLGAFKHCGNMAAAEDRLYVASGSDCLELDAQSGAIRQTLSVPPSSDGSGNEWGYVALQNDLLLGSAARAGAAFRDQTLDTEVLIWRDFMPVVCSDSVFAHERSSARRLWTYVPRQGVIINPTLGLGGGRVYFVESTNPATRLVADGRIKLSLLLEQDADLVALDVRTGQVRWRRAAELQAIQHMLYLSYAQEKILVTGTRNADVENGRRLRYDLAVFAADSGQPFWRNTQTPVPDHILEGPHGEQVQHPAIVGDVIYGNGFACHLDTGRPIDGWKWKKSGNCSTLSTSAACAFGRASTPWMFDLHTGDPTALSTTARPGCWINIIPAGGMILMPEASAGCTCGYAVQASMAFIPRRP